VQKFTYTIKDPVGMHARPAALLVKTAMTYKAKGKLSCNNKEADLTRLIALMTLGVKQGMKVVVTFEGEDEKEATEALAKVLSSNL